MATGISPRRRPGPNSPRWGCFSASYAFTRYRAARARSLRFACPEGADVARVKRLAEGVFLARDLINTPANDMGPSAIEQAVRELADRHRADVTVTVGDALLQAGFPMIHAVGRASADAPRLIDMKWGRAGRAESDAGRQGRRLRHRRPRHQAGIGHAADEEGHGRGCQCDRAGRAWSWPRASTCGCGCWCPAVENSIAGSAFRPGDVLKSRKGITVEIGNTDAEGRLVLADALALADEEAPQIMLDMATLTGAARVALGPELPPFFTDDETLAAELAAASAEAADPMWRMPLWQPYEARLASKVADTSNVTTDGFAGSVTAALFLKKFVDKAAELGAFRHLSAGDPIDRPHCPVGGEAQAIRAIERVLQARFGQPSLICGRRCLLNETDTETIHREPGDGMAINMRPSQALRLWQQVSLDEVVAGMPDLSMRQMAILLTIYLEPPPHTVRGLAARLGVTKPVITRALDTMGALKLVSRHRDEADRRNVLVKRTVEGALFVERFGDEIIARAKELPI